MNQIQHPIQRKKTKRVQIGSAAIGGNAPVLVQSMTCTKTEDVAATLTQIHALEAAGCELVRVAVPGAEAAAAIADIKQETSLPVAADIHFDYRLAIKAMEAGADKIRINPGNIGEQSRVEAVLKTADERGIPIRIGVNSGSLEKSLIEKYGGVTARGLVDSAMKHVTICESFGFDNIVLSIKASDVWLMIETNRLLSEKVDYPLHLGVTEAGTPRRGILRSSVGIGTLLAEGIGDTIRVSLTGDPVEEIKAAYDILKSLHLREKGITLISCPTCGRTQTQMIPIAEKVEDALADIDKSLTVAIMGCAVNGPGEAKEADIGIACGKDSALLFKKGETICKLAADEIVPRLIAEVESWNAD